MAILRVKDDEGNIIDIPAIKGDAPKKGIDYWTAKDKQEIVAEVLNSLPNASGVSF